MPNGQPAVGLDLPPVSTNSRSWKLAVMESLQIRSPSMPTLTPGGEDAEHRLDRPLSCQSRSDPLMSLASEAPPRLSLMKGSLDQPFGLCTPKHSIEILRSAFESQFPHTGKLSDLSTEPSITSHAVKKSVEGSKFGFGNKHGKHRSSAASVHLYNMRISHHLRSESSINSAAVTTAASTALPTRSHTPLQRVLSQTGTVSLPVQFPRRQRQNSRSCFTSGDVPQGWGNVVRDTASSIYSTTANSPLETAPSSMLHLSLSSTGDHLVEQHQKQDEITRTADENSPLSNDESRTPSSEENKAVPGNLSSSNLSNGSKSSKTSRFKEDFEPPEAKRSSTRNSIVNLFHRSRGKRVSESLGSYDGSADEHEPKYLQQAMALADRPDATGLLAKAIKAQQHEKSKMYLSTNKEKAPREMFRRRSSSFSKPHTPINCAGPSDSISHPESDPIPSQRRVSSAAHMKPEMSMPEFSTSPSVPRLSKKHMYSTIGQSKSEFSLPLFANQDDGDDVPTECRIRNSAVKVDPMDTTPDIRRTSTDIRSPSFQLNDVPVVIESLPASPSTPRIEGAPSKCSNETHEFDIPSNLEEDAHLDLGSWSRYPSHTREKRTGSAGTPELVKTRDFAYDINPASIATDSSTEDSVKNTKKKGKKKTKARTGLPKSKSMMIGKDFIRNYARIIRSPSVEWLSHGKGHRSSVSAGGSLAHPELEVLPSVFAPMPTSIGKIEEEEEDDGIHGIPLHQAHKNTIANKPKSTDGLRQVRPYKCGRHNSSAAGPSRFDGSYESTATDQRERRTASTPSLPLHDDNFTFRGEEGDSALTWSRHYASCVKLPRNSASLSHSKISTDRTRADTSMTLSDADSNTHLIDAMLASRNTSIRHVNKSLSVDSSVNIVNYTFPGRIKLEMHKKHQSMGSMASLRASSMDLLKKLALAEESERMKCLQLLTSSTSERDGEVSKEGVNESMQVQQVQLCSEDGPMALSMSSTTHVVVEAN
jgi:hypothetical protein